MLENRVEKLDVTDEEYMELVFDKVGEIESDIKEILKKRGSEEELTTITIHAMIVSLLSEISAASNVPLSAKLNFFMDAKTIIDVVADGTIKYETVWKYEEE